MSNRGEKGGWERIVLVLNENLVLTETRLIRLDVIYLPCTRRGM
jgi:hypothetical protein